MKVGIIYASTHGTTEKVAGIIQQGLNGHQVDVINLKKNRSFTPNSYEFIIMGGSIHAGKLSARLKRFMQKNLTNLLNRKLALFMCCMNEPEADKQFNTEFPELLREHSVCNKVVGGEFLIEEMNFVEKLLVKKVAGVESMTSKINYGAIDELVKSISNQ